MTHALFLNGCRGCIAEAELPSPWQELKTPEGKKYYYNPDTKVSV